MYLSNITVSYLAFLTTNPVSVKIINSVVSNSVMVKWTAPEFSKSKRAVENREKWRKLVAKSSVVPQ